MPKRHTVSLLLLLQLPLLLWVFGVPEVADAVTLRRTYTEVWPNTAFHMDYRPSVAVPNWARDTPSPNFRISAWNQCPNNTDYVLRGRASPVGQSADFPYDFVLGCCPTNFTGCTLPGNDRVIGCCPAGQQCTYRPGNRAYTGGQRFKACVDIPSQDCLSVRCPVGYLCCPHKSLRKSVCVPHNGDPTDYDAVCGTPVPYSPYMLSPSLQVRDYFHYNAPPRMTNMTLMTIQGFANVSAELSPSPPQFQCPSSQARCRIGDLCSESTFTNAGSNVTQTRLTHCCPVNHTFCHGFNSEKSGRLPPTAPGGFIGCADDAAGEQCCGDSICPAGHKCCSSVNPFSGELMDKQCCPEELECCYGSPGQRSVGLALFDGAERLPRSYCGMTVFNISCAMDRWAPSQNFVLDRVARGGSFPQLDP